MHPVHKTQSASCCHISGPEPSHGSPVPLPDQPCSLKMSICSFATSRISKTVHVRHCTMHEIISGRLLEIKAHLDLEWCSIASESLTLSAVDRLCLICRLLGMLSLRCKPDQMLGLQQE